MRKIVLIAHNIRSTHNVGSLLRTAEGLGIDKVYLTGYTPYPQHKHDARLPYLAAKLNKSISKTALGAEKLVKWDTHDNIKTLINQLKTEDFKIFALEQTENSIPLPKFKSPLKSALLLGEEVNGISGDLLKLCDQNLEIPMFGKKESFNVAVAAAMALYQLRFF